MKLLLPIDIAHPPGATLEQLPTLVPLANVEVTILYVKEEWPSYEKVVESMGDFKEDWGHQLEAKAKAAFDEASARLTPFCDRISTEIVTGPPAMMIEEVARDEQFDMTVLTPGRHSPVENFLLGSVTSGVMKHCPGTVLICRADPQPVEKLTHVVMGIDGSGQSHHAVARAAEQFRLKERDTRVTLIHVVNVADVFKLISPVEYITMVENNLLLEGETFLAEGKNLLAERGVTKVDCVLKEGDPATEIINLAEALPAELVVIGAQGRTAVQHFLMGSVSHKIAMRSPCSTAVVKPPRA